MSALDDAPLVQPADREEWHAWLEANHATARGVWLVSWRSSSGRTPFPYEDAIEEALCFGWVDSRANRLDDERSMLWFAPRRARSGWSAPNKRRVEALLAAGAMADAGLAKIEAAKRDGSWSALDAVEALQIPPDLAAALAAHGEAAAHFEAFPRSVRRGILEWIGAAKKPETRAKRVAETARLAAQGERANQWRQRP